MFCALEVSDLITVRLGYQDDGRLLFAVGRLNGVDGGVRLIRYFTGLCGHPLHHHPPKFSRREHGSWPDHSMVSR